MPMWSQTKDLIAVDKDSLYRVFINYDKAKNHIDVLEGVNNALNQKVDIYQQKDSIQIKIIENYKGIIVPGKNQIIQALSAQVKDLKKNRFWKWLVTILEGMAAGAAIILFAGL